MKSSALQRAEIAEMMRHGAGRERERGFSALQRAEIAEMQGSYAPAMTVARVSVLFNEPKLLKCWFCPYRTVGSQCFSALQRAEIAEI